MIARGRLPILLLLLLSTGFASPALALNFNAFWLYRERGAENTDTRREFQQTYKLGAGPGLTFQPTRAITGNFFLDYSRTQRDQGQGKFVTVDRLTPSANIQVANDIFVARLGGFVTKTKTSNRKGKEPTTRNWETSLGSAWQIPLWPSVALSYSERTEERETSENQDRTTGLAVNWDLILAQLYYQYTGRESEDLIGGSLDKSDTHFVRLDTGGQFLQKRIRFDLSQQVQVTTRDFSVGDMGEETLGFVSGQTTVKVDDPTDPDPTDLDYVDPTGPLPQGVDNDKRVHLRFTNSTFPPDPFDVLRLTLANFLDAQAALNLQWALFFKANSSDLSWVPVSGQFQVVVSADVENSIEIRLADPLEAADFLLVATNDSGSTVTFNALQAFVRLTQDTSSRSTSYLGNFSTSIKLTSTLRASSHASLELASTEAAGTTTDAGRLSVGGSLGWLPTPLCSPTLGFSQTLQEQTDQEALLSRSYSLIVTSVPLPTLNLSLGATRSERFTGDLKTQTSDTYTLSTAARIYPDLNAGLVLSYRDGERLDSEGVSTTTDIYSARLTANARINPKLSSELTTNYSRTVREIGTTSTSDSTLTLLYRPSDYLSSRLTGTKFWTRESGTDSISLNLDLAVLRTDKTRMTFRYGHRQARSVSDDFGLDWSWNISRLLYLQTKLNYTKAETYVYNIEAFLSLRL